MGEGSSPQSQIPAVQILVPPHEVPLGNGPVSVQTGAPVEQLMEPTWQGLVGVQVAPALHVGEEQTPAEQICPAKQLVPHDPQ